MTLGKLKRAKALQGADKYELTVNGKRVVHINPNSMTSQIELVLEGEEEGVEGAARTPQAPKQEGVDQQMIDEEGNYVMF